MTKNEAKDRVIRLMKDDGYSHDLILGGAVAIEMLYRDNLEVIVRTIDEDTARNLDNELSAEEWAKLKGGIMVSKGGVE